MARTVGACLVVLVILAPAATANNPGAAGRSAVYPRSLAETFSAVSVQALQDGIRVVLGGVTVFRPTGRARRLLNRAANTSARCGSDLAFTPESTCIGACDVSKGACDRKCSMGMNSCLTECPLLGFACDAYCRAALVVCHGNCARAHDACANTCPARGGGESKGMVTNRVVVQ